MLNYFMVNNGNNYKAFELLINSDFIKLPELIKCSHNKEPDITIIEDNYKNGLKCPLQITILILLSFQKMKLV